MFAIEKYKFCPGCKASFEKKGGNLLVCPKCDLYFYINPLPCSAVFLFNEKHEVLLARRAFDPFKGTWDAAGGIVEPNETLEESVYREIKEELGIVPEKITYVKSYYDTYLYKGVTHYTLGCVFTGIVPAGSVIKPQDDVLEAKFFKLSEVPLEEVGFPAVREAIGELD